MAPVTPMTERIKPAVIPKNQWIWKNTFLNMGKNGKMMKFLQI
jgi:hypothetical protein